MNKGRNREALQSEIKGKAIAFAYDNVPDLRQLGIVVHSRDCSVKRVVYHQSVVGPGEAIDTILPDEEWEVSIPLKVFSKFLIIPVRRYHDGSLEVGDDMQSLPM